MGSFLIFLFVFFTAAVLSLCRRYCIRRRRAAQEAGPIIPHTAEKRRGLIQTRILHSCTHVTQLSHHRHHHHCLHSLTHAPRPPRMTCDTKTKKRYLDFFRTCCSSRTTAPPPPSSPNGSAAARWTGRPGYPPKSFGSCTRSRTSPSY